MKNLEKSLRWMVSVAVATQQVLVPLPWLNTLPLAEAASPFPGELHGTQIGAGLPSPYEPSGAVWHPRLNKLFVVSDNGKVSRMNADGTEVVTWTIGGDLEGITIADPSTELLYLGRETGAPGTNGAGIIEFNQATGTKTGREFLIPTSLIPAGSNAGLEALTFVPVPGDSEGGVFCVGHQANGKIYVLRLSLSAGTTVTRLATLQTRYADGANLSDVAGLEYSAADHLLYATYDVPLSSPTNPTREAILQVMEVVPTVDGLGQVTGLQLRLWAEWLLSGNDQEGVAVAGHDLFVTEDVGKEVWKYSLGTLQALPATLDFGAATTSQTVQIAYTGGGLMPYTLTTSQPWLSVPATAGVAFSTTQALTLTVNRAGLAAGLYIAKLTLTPLLGSAVAATTVDVAMTVGPVGSAPLTPVVTASRLGGIAPLGVVFDASATTSPSTAKPFHELDYTWEFGDPGATFVNRPGVDANQAKGPIAAHVFELPDADGDGTPDVASKTYTVTLTVKDSTGTTATWSQPITATAFPASPATGVTSYVSASAGNDAWSGTLPAPNVAATDGPFQTWGKGISTLFAQPGHIVPRRLLFKRGETFPATGPSVVGGTKPGPYLVGAYGSGAKPVIEAAYDGSTSTVLGFPSGVSEVRLTDVDFIYRRGGAPPYGLGIATDSLLLRSAVSGFAFGLTNANAERSRSLIVDSSFLNNGHYGMYYDWGRHVAILANQFDQVQVEHLLRSYLTHALIAHNTFQGGVAGKVQLKFVGFVPGQRPGADVADYSLIADNEFTDPGPIHWPVVVGPPNDTTDARIEHVIFERNLVRAGPHTSQLLGLNARSVTVRNNVFDGTGSEQDLKAVSIYREGIEPPPHDLTLSHNTAYHVGSLGRLTLVQISSEATNTVVRNNLASMAAGLTGVLIEGGGSGLVEDHNVLASPSIFVDAAAGDVHLSGAAGAEAIDQGIEVPVFDDRDGVSRPQGGGFDLGAYEYGAAGPVNLAPTVDAGRDHVIDLPDDTVTLTGTVSDDGRPDPPGAVSVVWSQESGPDGVMFDAQTALTTAATFPEAGTYLLRLTASDGELPDYDDAWVTLNPAPNQPPTAIPQAVTTAEDTATAITLEGTDIDGDPLTYEVGDPAHGTLTGEAPTLVYTPESDYHGADAFIFTVSDGAETSAEATIALTVTPVNDAPLAQEDAATTPEDVSVRIQVLRNDRDADEDVLRVESWTAPAHGTVEREDDDALRYTPAPDYSGLDQFTYTASDGRGGLDEAIVTLTITPVNDAPVAQEDAATVPEDSLQYAISVLDNDTDVDDALLRIVSVSSPAHGSAQVGADETVVLYTPSPDYIGTDALTYTIHDAAGEPATAGVMIIVTHANNDAPMAEPQAVTTEEDAARAITLGGRDADGDALAYAVVALPLHGMLSGTPPALTYTPEADYFGNDRFTFTAGDGVVPSEEAIVAITITSVNDAPVADTPEEVSLDEDTTATIIFTGQDRDGSIVAARVATPPAHGSVTMDEPLHAVYTPTADYHGRDAFTIQAQDHEGAWSEAVTVSLKIKPVNDPPVAHGRHVKTERDQSVTITVEADDPDGDTLTYEVSAAPTHGTLLKTLGEDASAVYVYAPAPAFVGADAFQVEATDGMARSAAATITIAVTEPPPPEPAPQEPSEEPPPPSEDDEEELIEEPEEDTVTGGAVYVLTDEAGSASSDSTETAESRSPEEDEAAAPQRPGSGPGPTGGTMPRRPRGGRLSEPAYPPRVAPMEPAFEPMLDPMELTDASDLSAESEWTRAVVERSLARAPSPALSTTPRQRTRSAIAGASTLSAPANVSAPSQAAMPAPWYHAILRWQLRACRQAALWVSRPDLFLLGWVAPFARNFLPASSQRGQRSGIVVR